MALSTLITVSYRTRRMRLFGLYFWRKVPFPDCRSAKRCWYSLSEASHSGGCSERVNGREHSRYVLDAVPKSIAQAGMQA